MLRYGQLKVFVLLGLDVLRLIYLDGTLAASSVLGVRGVLLVRNERGLVLTADLAFRKEGVDAVMLQPGTREFKRILLQS